MNLKRAGMSGEDSRAALRFIVPVTIENAATIVIGLVFSALIGGISSSSLTAISTANLVVNFYTAAFSLLTSGAAVLTARLIGARDAAGASRTVEQSILMSLSLSALLTVLSLFGAGAMMRLLMPSAEKRLLDEAIMYMRILSLSLPGLMLYNVLVCVMRAGGNTRAPMLTALAMNISQIFFAWLFISVSKMGVKGAGMAFVCCRTIGGALVFAIVLKSHSQFFVHPGNLLRLDMPTVKRITRLGLPTSLESCFVQAGYIIANSLVVGLGTREATVYQIANTLQTFSNLPLSVGSAMSTAFVGHRLGAKNYDGAKKYALRILLVGTPIILFTYLVMAILCPVVAPLYTDDMSVAQACGGVVWVLMFYSLPAYSINVIDPALRVGGDVKFVLLETLVGVWAVRLPLTLLLCYYWKMGVSGVYIANIISLAVRAACGLLRYRSGVWMYKRV